MQENIHENPQILKQIEWDTLRNRLVDCAHFVQTPKNIFKYKNNKEDIELALYKTKHFMESLYNPEFKDEMINLYNLDSEADFFSFLQLIQKDAALPLSDINELAKIIEFFLSGHKVLLAHGHTIMERDQYNRFRQRITKAFLKEFRGFVDESGEVDLNRHPRIRPLFQKQVEIEANIRNQLGQMLHSADLQKKIQFTSYDIVNDRFVLPIKSDSFSSKIGQIVSRSETGHTLFVEPHQVSNLNYKRIEIIVEIQAIISQIELSISKALAEFVPELKNIIDTIYELDELNTRSEFAIKLNLSEPILTNKKIIKLFKAFHPLIERPVKNNIEVTETHEGLIISGPNTGGKTATLKTLALTQLLIRYGLFIPCDHGEIFLYDKVFYFGNDQQNLIDGLSSFAAEVENYASLFDHLGSSNMILIDEIFNSTSSEEASALAIAFFQKLKEISNCHIIVSSHHQTLKTFLHQDENFISAHVGFDTDNNAPTYQLHYGSPGSSHALRIFQSMTKHRDDFLDIYQNSLKFLDNKIIHYEKLLDSIAQKENELKKLITSNDDINRQLKNQKQSMDGVIKLKIDEKISKTQAKLDKLISRAEAIVNESKKGNITKTKEVYKKGDAVKSELRSLKPEEPKEEDKKYENLSVPKNIEEGKSYFCLMVKKTVLVKKVDIRKKQAQIVVGKLHMKAPLNSLRVANQRAPQPKQQEQKISITSSRSQKLEYDCRGMRLEEFQDTVEKAVSDLMLGHTPFLTIVHGHGTGVLKNWLRKYLKSHSDITIQENETGNDGETRIQLK